MVKRLFSLFIIMFIYVCVSSFELNVMSSDEPDVVMEPSESDGTYPEWKNFTVTAGSSSVFMLAIEWPPEYHLESILFPSEWPCEWPPFNKVEFESTTAEYDIMPGENKTFKLEFVEGPDEGAFNFTVDVMTRDESTYDFLLKQYVVAYKVHNIDTGMNYTSIQAAIDAPETSGGHTILVNAGIYYEHVVVSKSISLIGEGEGVTIIDGDLVGTVVKITADNTRVTGFTIQKGGFETYQHYSAIQIASSNNVIANNDITDNKDNGIWLESSSRNNTITQNNITNSSCGICLNYASDNVLTHNNIANNNLFGILLTGSSNINIAGNDITNMGSYGIAFSVSHNNSITGNNITNNQYGAFLDSSFSNTFRNNVLDYNARNFGIISYQLSEFINDIDTSNTVDGKPIYYWVNRHNEEVPLDAGFIGLVNCTNITIKNQYVTNNFQGVLLAYTNNSRIEKLNITNNQIGIHVCRPSGNNTISDSHIKNNWMGILLDRFSENNNVLGNNVTDNYYGIELRHTFGNRITNNTITDNKWKGISLGTSSDNIITENNIANNNDTGISIAFSDRNVINGNNIIDNNIGVWLGEVHHNKIFHNNFINNTQQIYPYNPYENTWHDGYPSGGNYWNDYNGTDSDYDGIGDTPYIIDENNQDNYPLMGLFSDFTVWEDIPYHITTICNSTIYNFHWAYLLNITTGTWEKKELVFSVLGPEDTVGFCRIMIPRAFMAGPYTVYVYGEEVNATELPISNVTHAFLYFTYTHPAHIAIVPEFPSFLILPLFMIATLLAVIVYRRKH